MIDEPDHRMPSAPEDRFGANIDDVVIMPLVLLALGIKKLLHLTLSILIHIIDYAFPIILGLMRFPLFTARIIGDGFIAVLKFIVICLPVSRASRNQWREAVSQGWSWLRQKLSYKVFEEAVHHAFENGMAWVFRKCRHLTPFGALLTIGGAVLWLPISFGTATAIHMVLIAKAATLPPWMQLLHPLATVIAKSKLLVLPVYPAAWPQAKKHASLQAIFKVYRAFMNLYVARKTAHRYQQTTDTVDGWGRAASRVCIGRVCNGLLALLNRVTTWLGQTSRAALARATEVFSATPLIGTLLGYYAARYAETRQPREEKFSERVHGFFDRWSIKFSAEYYEAKEREQAAQRMPLTEAEDTQP